MWLDPVIFEIGFLQIRWYGLVYVLGAILSYLFLLKFRKEVGISKSEADDLMLYLILGMLIGARLFHFLFSDPMVFIEEPLELFRIWHGGMSFFGGLIGILIATRMYLRKRWSKYLILGDIVVVPISFTLIFGRLANFINNELVGTISNVSWCVEFPNYLGCRHPYQIYAAIGQLILFLIILIIFFIKEKKNMKDGIVFFSFLFFYGVIRFITDFFRMDLRLNSLTIWQYLSLILVFISMILFYFYLKKSDEKKNK